MDRIVVGVDGSEHGLRALEWAVEEARVRKASVQAIHAWHYPYMAPYPYAATMMADPKEIEEGARETLAKAVDSVDTSKLKKPVEQTLVAGGAAQALIEASKGAAMVVIGSRGLGGFTGLLLGSVSHQVAQHATCPVVILPAS